MKIAVLGTRGFPGVQGGVEAHCENLYPRLAAKGHNVTVFTRLQYVDPSIKEFRGVKLIPLACPRNKFLEAFGHTLKGVLAAKKLRPDILHIHAAGPSMLTPLARLLGMKVVITSHGPEYERKKWKGFPSYVLRLGEYLGCSYANKIICVSQSHAERLRLKYRKEVTLLPNGVVMPRGQNVDSPQKAGTASILQKFGLERGKYILAVGRFVPEKGFETLIEAFAAIQGQSPKSGDGPIRCSGWKLAIAGKADHEDKYSRELRAKAEDKVKAGIPVVLTGFLTGEPLAELYSHAGLFVLPSYYEGLPIALLEAMSYGLSCVVSDIPANREVGLAPERYFKPGDIPALMAKLSEFIQKPLSPEEKASQIKSISERYEWDKIAERTLEVYRRVMS